jgi:hypothetical protein
VIRNENLGKKSIVRSIEDILPSPVQKHIKKLIKLCFYVFLFIFSQKEALKNKNIRREREGREEFLYLLAIEVETF